MTTKIKLDSIVEVMYVCILAISHKKVGHVWRVGPTPKKLYLYTNISYNWSKMSYMASIGPQVDGPRARRSPTSLSWPPPASS